MPASKPSGVLAPVRLGPQHDLSEFRNGKHDSLDAWLRDRALASEGLSARTYETLPSSATCSIGLQRSAASAPRKSASVFVGLAHSQDAPGNPQPRRRWVLPIRGPEAHQRVTPRLCRRRSILDHGVAAAGLSR